MINVWEYKCVYPVWTLHSVCKYQKITWHPINMYSFVLKAKNTFYRNKLRDFPLTIDQS